MGNMSYCRFENTSLDLQDCINTLELEKIEDLSVTEKIAADKMRQQCEEYIRLYNEKTEEIEP